MNVYDVSAVLMLDSSEFSRNLDTAIRSLEKFGETAGRIFDEISKAAEFMTANVGA